MNRPTQMFGCRSARLVTVSLVLGGLCSHSAGAADRAADNAAPTTKNQFFNPAEIEPVAMTAAGGSERTRRIGEDWPEFLGPRGNGISGETGLLEKWPTAGPPIVWQRKIGTNYTAPSIRGNRLVLFHRVKDEEVIECREADTGKFLWKWGYETRYEDPYGYNNGPRSSALLTEDRCYTYGAEGKLTCLKLETGEKVWLRDTVADFKIPRAFFGIGASPILEGNLLIVMVGGHPKSGLVAFDAGTGKTVWQNVGPESFPVPPYRIQRDRPPEKLASYATPLAATIHGKRQVLAFMRPGLAAVDPQTGELNFSFWFRSIIHDSVNAARPVVVGDQVFLSAAYETGAVLLKVRDDGKAVETVWSDVDAMQTHWSTTIHHNGYLYGFSGRHQPGSNFRCIELKTGKLQWRTHDVNDNEEPDAKAGLGQTAPRFYGRGSAILADGKFIVMGENGLLALVELNPTQFHEISRVQYPELGYPSWVAPVLSRRRLYITGSKPLEGHPYEHEYHLICLDLAKKPGSPDTNPKR